MACCHGDLAAGGNVCSGHLYRNQGASRSRPQAITDPITTDSREQPATSVHVNMESELLPVGSLWVDHSKEALSLDAGTNAEVEINTTWEEIIVSQSTAGDTLLN